MIDNITIVIVIAEGHGWLQDRLSILLIIFPASIITERGLVYVLKMNGHDGCGCKIASIERLPIYD
jgi:hypothetical protein